MIYATCLIVMFILSQTTINFSDFPLNILDRIVQGLCFPGSTFLQSGVYVSAHV